jgi:hypothetical protein
MRVVPHITSRINSINVPTAEWFSSITGGFERTGSSAIDFSKSDDHVLISEGHVR